MKELLVLIFIIIFIIFIILIYHVQSNVLFRPEDEHVWEPPVDYEDFFIDNVHVWHINNFENRPVVLYCHGNNANISYREYVYCMFQTFEFNIVLFDYQGYGKSKGRPTQKKICQDGESVYLWLIKRYSPNSIIVWGESLGGAVATYIASRYVCRCLILFSTFSSIDEAITQSKLYPWWIKSLAVTASWFLDTLPSKIMISDVTEPILIVHSLEDEIIPISNAYALFKNIIHDEREFLTIKGKHINPDMSPKQFRELYHFCHNANSYHEYKTSDDFESKIEATFEAMEKGAKKAKDLSQQKHSEFAKRLLKEK